MKCYKHDFSELIGAGSLNRKALGRKFVGFFRRY